MSCALTSLQGKRQGLFPRLSDGRTRTSEARWAANTSVSFFSNATLGPSDFSHNVMLLHHIPESGPGLVEAREEHSQPGQSCDPKGLAHQGRAWLHATQQRDGHCWLVGTENPRLSACFCGRAPSRQFEWSGQCDQWLAEYPVGVFTVSCCMSRDTSGEGLLRLLRKVSDPYK